MVDESQDVAVNKRLVNCVRYINNRGSVVTKFLCNIRVEDGKAHTITFHIFDVLSHYKVDMTKLVSLGSDGASVMMGQNTGVGVQLQAKYSPFMLHSHCIAHRLALACGDSIKGIAVLEKFKTNFNLLFFVFKNSAIKSTKLEKVQELLQDPILKMKEQHTVRWLSIRNAVNAVYMSYPSVVVSLSEIGKHDATARGLHKYFELSKTALLTAFMHDVHTRLAVLSSELQKQDLVFSEVKPLMEATISALKDMKDGGVKFVEMKAALGEEFSLSGVTLVKLNPKQEADLISVMEKYVEKLVHNIQERMLEASDMLNYFGYVLEPATFSLDEKLADVAITKLGEFYGTGKVTKIYNTESESSIETNVQPLIDKEQMLAEEWPMLKGMLRGSYKSITLKEMCKRIICMHDKLMPNVSKLSQIALCICLTSVESERSFSTQNKIKTKFRASLKPEKLDILLKINLVGPSLTDCSVKLNRAIRNWHSVKTRRLGRLSQAYRPTGPKKKKTMAPSFVTKK